MHPERASGNSEGKDITLEIKAKKKLRHKAKKKLRMDTVQVSDQDFHLYIKFSLFQIL